MSAGEVVCGGKDPRCLLPSKCWEAGEQDLLAEQVLQPSRLRPPPARANSAGRWEGENVSLQEGGWEAVRKIWCREETRRASVIGKICLVLLVATKAGLGEWDLVDVGGRDENRLRNKWRGAAWTWAGSKLSAALLC